VASEKIEKTYDIVLIYCQFFSARFNKTFFAFLCNIFGSGLDPDPHPGLCRLCSSRGKRFIPNQWMLNTYTV
jgi:hypothetical protein